MVDTGEKLIEEQTEETPQDRNIIIIIISILVELSSELSLEIFLELIIEY
jgi:hypothetical protein